MVIFCLGLDVIMAKGRRLRKSGGGELEGNKQNVDALDDAIVVPNVARGDEVVGESHVVALDATIVEQNNTTLNATIV
jgi:hypothetical protein